MKLQLESGSRANITGSGSPELNISKAQAQLGLGLEKSGLVPPLFHCFIHSYVA